ncbi:hypothetical protein GYH30_048254 [Glycine max]|nr:hypothetical protein JHK86_048510 [Glycine max]KAH1119803.1 hypothetical protein GYH30_048254 [Glycine max]
MMRSKKQSQNKFVRIMASPIRALGKARDMYVRSITNCGQHVSYYGGDPTEGAGRFSRSHSVATSTRSEVVSEDYAELLRAASARTLANRIDMDLVLKQQQQQHANSSKGNNLPKSSSVGMARIEEDKPYDSEKGVTDSYPRSRSYAVEAKRRPSSAFQIPSSRLVSI